MAPESLTQRCMRYTFNILLLLMIITVVRDFRWNGQLPADPLSLLSCAIYVVLWFIYQRI
ncbi:hypothetical protein DENSPDRAFT_840750 [Dentipellis sp. KUC8613]|nr:hypothetical protein DENSPDRAFT_840750 [Dentipellis sp. KUC8613]